MKAIYRLAIFFAIVIWVLLIFAEPISAKIGFFTWTIPLSQIIFSNVCHQEPTKLIQIGNYFTFACARCTGIYTGTLLASFLMLPVAHPKILHIKYLIFSAIPLLLDVALVNAGLYYYNKSISFGVGLIFGSAVFYYFYMVISSQLGKKN